jgi:hypothetical protein
MHIRKFLMDNILLPRDADGNVVDVNNISANLGAHIVMLAIDPDSYMSLNEIFAAPEKKLIERKSTIMPYLSTRRGIHWPVIFTMQMILIQKIFGVTRIPAFWMLIHGHHLQLRGLERSYKSTFVI